jgi:DNA-binding transcriptional ArsR family regulator
MGEAVVLDRVFGALADPTRRAIVGRLTEGEAGVLELAERFPISQPAISKHLRVLEEAGLVTRERAGRRNLCRLDARNLRAVAQWVTPYQRFWEQSFDRLDDVLAEEQQR